MRRLLSAVAMASIAAASANAASLEVTPIELGDHHCTEIWSKSPSSAPRNKLYTVNDLSDAGRDAFRSECAARGGIYSPDKCPRQKVVLVCPSESLNATGNIILYRGSADKDALMTACPRSGRFSGKGSWYALRTRPGRTIWASCLVP